MWRWLGAVPTGISLRPVEGSSRLFQGRRGPCFIPCVQAVVLVAAEVATGLAGPM